MKKFAFSLERMLNFQSQNLEKEMGILGRMTAERDALEAQKQDMAEKAAGVQADIARREAEGTTIFMLKACFSILESARNQLEEMEEELRLLQAGLERQRQIVTEASREVKKLEKLKEKQLEEYHRGEAKEQQEGRARNVGLELLNPGRRLADKQGGELIGVVIGCGIEEAVKAAVAYGADKVIAVDGEEYKHYTTDAYTDAVCALVEKYGPTTMLIGATNEGRDMGPRISCRLRTGLTADCTGLDIDEESGNMAWTRPAFGGNLMATILCPNHRPQIGTVRPGVFKKGERDDARQAEIIHEDIHITADRIRTRLVEVIHEMGAENVDLEGAEIIVSGGRGVGGPEGFAPLKELADLVGGVLGASRAAVDSGWIAHAHQVGQTGKTVGPKVYIACGISGAIQHVAGMSGSGTIIAINKDPEAPIFNIADYSVVGDLKLVIPVLIQEIKKSRA